MMTVIMIVVMSIVLFVVASVFFWLTGTIKRLVEDLNLFKQQINERLQETHFSLESTHKVIGERLDSATKVFGDLKLSLGKLEESYHQIYILSKDISSFQNLLRSPQIRGGLGETLLERLLEDIIPKDFIRFQYHFGSGEKVDAVIMIGKNLIPVDAKFPLDNFRKYSEAELETEKKTFYRAFVKDVKNRIDEVSTKYILPQQNTFDFAFIYIPAEAVYYHISKDEEIISYAKAKKVIFVSPNTFYAYLQAVLFGLKGINLQTNIKRVLAQLSQLQQDLKKFQDDFDLLGTHLINANKKYKDSKDKLETFSQRLGSATEEKIEYEHGGVNEQQKL